MPPCLRAMHRQAGGLRGRELQGIRFLERDLIVQYWGFLPGAVFCWLWVKKVHRIGDDLSDGPVPVFGLVRPGGDPAGYRHPASLVEILADGFPKPVPAYNRKPVGPWRLCMSTRICELRNPHSASEDREPDFHGEHRPCHLQGRNLQI